ncbi:MAG: XdhC family protein [Gemmatimonadota bacterium]
MVTGFAALVRAADAARALRPATPLALATLVAVEGSSYRQPGARLLVDADSRVLAGAISGGCLEGDVAARAAEVCASGQPALLRYDLRDDLEAIWGFGSACDGIATILLEPLLQREPGGWLAEAEATRMARLGGAVVTHVGDGDGASRDTSARGSSPVATTSLGTIAVVRGDTIAAVHDGASQTASRWSSLRWRDAIMRGAGLAQQTQHVHREPVDGGVLFIDPLVAPIALHVVGAGRGAEAFCSIARTLGWHATVLDHRPALLEALTLPPDVTSLHAHPNGAADVLRTLPTDSRTAVALLTHMFDTDLAWLSALLTTDVGYVGVLGSRQRAAKLIERLRAHASTEASQHLPTMLNRLHAPIGLDLGGETPESIALASIAEIEAMMHGRPGGSLRSRQSPIHERTPVPALQGATNATVGNASCDLP